MKTHRTYIVLLVLFLSFSGLPCQESGVDDKTRVIELENKIADLEKRLSDIEIFLQKPNYTSFYLNDGIKKCGVYLGVNEGKPGVYVNDDDGTLKAGIGLSENNGGVLYLGKGDAGSNDLILDNTSVILSKLQWELIKLALQNNDTCYLTSKLYQKSLKVLTFDLNPLFPYIFISVDTDVQPGWNYYIGNGRFSVSDRDIKAAYKEAAALLIADKIFPAINKSNNYQYSVIIHFTINGYDVGNCQDGEMKLSGE